MTQYFGIRAADVQVGRAAAYIGAARTVVQLCASDGTARSGDVRGVARAGEACGVARCGEARGIARIGGVRLIGRIGIVALAAGLLAGCGQRADLKPALGHALPPAAYGRAERPDARQLLAVAPEQRPVNSVELRIKSEPRGDDPFDLPPR